MLRHLSIRDFVIVAALDLEFDSGFTVFSGETGAGKSILIDALALALGERADASVVRTGSGRADISAEFTPHDRVARWLDEHAFDADDTVMLRRVVDANGRSRAFINGTSATLAQLREVGEMLVDIHGQHAHQLLMRADAQRELFDTHAGLAADAAAVTRGYRAWRDATHAIDAAQAHERERQLEREKLAWQLAELDKLAPQPGEWDEISAEHKRLTHSANLIDGVQGALNAISESDDAMLTQLGAIVSKLRSLAEYDPALNDALASLEPAEIQLQEASYSLSHYAQRLDLDPDRLAQVETRLDALHSTARKFRLPPETLHGEHEARRAQLAELDAAADLSALQAIADRAKDARVSRFEDCRGCVDRQRYPAVARRSHPAGARASASRKADVQAGVFRWPRAGGRTDSGFFAQRPDDDRRQRGRAHCGKGGGVLVPARHADHFRGGAARIAETVPRARPACRRAAGRCADGDRRVSERAFSDALFRRARAARVVRPVLRARGAVLPRLVHVPRAAGLICRHWHFRSLPRSDRV